MRGKGGRWHEFQQCLLQHSPVPRKMTRKVFRERRRDASLSAPAITADARRVSVWSEITSGSFGLTTTSVKCDGSQQPDNRCSRCIRRRTECTYVETLHVRFDTFVHVIRPHYDLFSARLLPSQVGPSLVRLETSHQMPR